MITTADFKNGVIFENDGNIYQVLWFQHHKPGKGGAVMRTKIKNVRTGSIIEQTFKSGEKFKDFTITRKKMQFLYSDERTCTFMDPISYEQISISKEKIEDLRRYLKEGLELDALYLEEELLGLDLPASVELKVVSTVPGIKGDSVSNMTKPATLETGVELLVPLFIKEDDVIRVDTRSGDYVERV